MVKSIISTLLAIALLITLSIIEQSIITNTFDELKENLSVVYAKTENQTLEKF